MKKFAAVAAIPFFAGFLWAQAEQTTRTETTTTRSTYNGTLVDASCQTTHTVHKETSNPDENTTKTTTTTTESTECPVTTTTTTFGLITPDGKYVRFDDPSNTRVIEMVKGNKKWHTYVEGKKPLKVRVVGTPNGDVMVVEKIQ